MEVIGILLFFIVVGMAFWLLIFLAVFVPGWATFEIMDQFNPKLVDKLFSKEEGESEEPTA